MSYYSTLRSDSESRIKGYESRAITALATRRPAGNLPVDIGGSLASRHMSGLLGSGESDRAGRDIGTFQSWVFACVNSIATRVAGQPWMAGELNGAAKKPSRSFGGAKSLSHPWLKRAVPDRIIAKAVADQELEMLASHPALDLMDQPNKLQRRWEFLYMSVANLALTGVCYWIGGLVKDGKNGDRMEIWAVPSSMLEPIHKDGLFSSYKWRSDMFGAGVMDDAPPIPAENVARTYMANPSDLTGVFSPLRACMRAVRTDTYIQDTQEQLFSHGMTPRLAVIVGEDPLGLGRPVRLNDVQRRQVTRAIEELWSWTVNNGRPAILDALIKDVKRIDPTAQEFEWQASGEIVRQRIFATYRVNKFIVGDSEQMNRAQVVEAQRQFADNVVNPICDSLSETACSWIAPMFGGKEQTGKARRLWIWVKPVSVQDPDMESRDWAMARKNGDVDRNEFRAERLGLPPKEDETQKSPLVETVGGVQGAIGVLTAIGQGMIERDSAVVIFREFYGLDPKTAEKLVGKVKERPPAPPQVPPPSQPGVAEQKPIAEPVPEQATGSSADEGSAIENIAAEAKGLKYDPAQPRIPAGSPAGGQWGEGGGASGGVGAGGGGNADDDDARFDMPDPTDVAAEAAAAKPKDLDSPTSLAERKSARKRDYDQIEELENNLAPGKLSAKEIAGVKTYTGNDYEEINAALRKGKDISSMSQKLQSLQQRAAQSLPTPPSSVVTYRGISIDVYQEHYAKNGPGSVIQGKGFISTSIDPKVAGSFGTVFLEIKAKTGVYVEPHTSKRGEKELVQAHGTKYRVVGSAQTEVDGFKEKRTVVKLEEI